MPFCILLLVNFSSRFLSSVGGSTDPIGSSQLRERVENKLRSSSMEELAKTVDTSPETLQLITDGLTQPPGFDIRQSKNPDAHLWCNSVKQYQCTLVWIQSKHLLCRARDDPLCPPALSVRTHSVPVHVSRCNSIASDRSALPPNSSATQLLCFWQRVMGATERGWTEHLYSGLSVV